MTREEFQALHSFDDQEMTRLGVFRAVLGATRPAVVMPVDSGYRWVRDWEIAQKGHKNG